MNSKQIYEWIKAAYSKYFYSFLLGGICAFLVVGIVGYVFNKPALICPIQREFFEEILEKIE